MAISQLYPNSRPTLNLNFARSKTLDPRITFTRNSTATYVGSDGLIKTAAAGEARFDHDPVTGDCRGLLVEESRTNSVQTSSDFTGFPIWGTASVTASSGTAPDGTNTATLVTPTGSGGRTSIYKPLGFGSGTVATVSIYAKPSGKSWIWLLDPGSQVYVFFNVSTGVVGTVDSSVTNTSIEPAGNGWYRCSVTRTPTANYQINFGVCDGDNSEACAVNGSDGILFWGGQLEEGRNNGFPTSYIPTAGSTITRAADLCEITNDNLSSWYNSNEGTNVIEYNSVGHSRNGGVEVYLNYIVGNYRFEFNVDGKVTGRTVAVQVWGDLSPALLHNVNNKVACSQSWLTGEGSFSSNGIDPIVATNNPTNPPYNPTRMAFGFGLYQNRGYGMNGYIQRFSYYPTRVSDSQLQELTS